MTPLPKTQDKPVRSARKAHRVGMTCNCNVYRMIVCSRWLVVGEVCGNRDVQIWTYAAHFIRQANKGITMKICKFDLRRLCWAGCVEQDKRGKTVTLLLIAIPRPFNDSKSESKFPFLNSSDFSYIRSRAHMLPTQCSKIFEEIVTNTYQVLRCCSLIMIS